MGEEAWQLCQSQKVTACIFIIVKKSQHLLTCSEHLINICGLENGWLKDMIVFRSYVNQLGEGPSSVTA